MSAEQKHTPGEWEAVLNDDPRGQPVAYYRGLICTVEHGGRYLAVVAKIGCALPAQWEANARLIAAAPDLLAALKLLVSDVADYEAWQRPCHALDVANAAISKAEGK